MKPYVITLSRQFASMGRAIAQSMSGELGINFYDRDIVEETAKRLGLSVSYVSKVEETGASFFSRLRYPLGMGLISTQKETFEIQSNIIRDLAQKESCIIVGRCADSVLRDHPRCLNIYIYAPYEKRLANCIREVRHGGVCRQAGHRRGGPGQRNLPAPVFGGCTQRAGSSPHHAGQQPLWCGSVGQNPQRYCQTRFF